MTLSPEAVRAWRAELDVRMSAAEHGLETLRAAPLPAGTGVVVAAVRDEITHLPYFFHHHRAAGARRFVIIDNGSVDGTLEYLLAQPDCDLYRHRGDYLESSASAVWRNLLLDRYAGAGWRLSIDADEAAVYPGWPRRLLDEFAADMRRAGRSVVNAIMLDMYGPGPVLQTRVGPDGDLLAACSLFDGDGYTIESPADWRTDRFPRLNIRGGPEMRAIRPRSAFGWLAKMALVLEPGIVYRDPHTVYPFKLNFDVPGIALLHFRFFDHLERRFGLKLADIGSRRATPGSVVAYDQLASHLRDSPGFSFAYPGSVRFESPQQLLERGLIAT